MDKQRKARRKVDRPLNKIDGENRARSFMNLSWIEGRPSNRKSARDESGADEPRDLAFRRVIFSIPSGKVSTYGGVAAAAGFPRLHRAVARLLSTDAPDQLPWHRVLGAGGEIKLSGARAREQQARLKLEGVKFIGKRADMEHFEHFSNPPGLTPE